MIPKIIKYIIIIAHAYVVFLLVKVLQKNRSNKRISIYLLIAFYGKKQRKRGREREGERRREKDLF